MRVSSIQAEDITTFSITQIGECLQVLGLGKYAALFADKQVDGELIKALDREDFMGEDFKMTSFEAKKLTHFLAGWKPKK